MEDVETLIEHLRTLFADLAHLQLMNGPEMLLPGRVERYHLTLESAQEAYDTLRTHIEALGTKLQEEQQRLDRGVAQFGPRADEE